MKVILADDHVIVRMAIATMLQQNNDIEIVGTASDGEEAYLLVEKHKPDIVLMDISMPPGENGIQAAGKILKDFPDTKIIILSMHADREYLMYAIRAGVSGYVLKNASEEELYRAIQTVYLGGMYTSNELRGYLHEVLSGKIETKDSLELLTEREKEILILIARGYGNKEISEKLFISVKTVESAKTKIMNKINVYSRRELVEYAIQKKLLIF